MTNARNRNLLSHSTLAATLTAVVLSACAGSDELNAPPTATLAGSERAAELGVSTWEVTIEGDGARVIGFDANHVRQAELVVMPDASTPDDRVDVEAVFPERGQFELARGGVVDGAPTEFLRQLGAAVNADMGEHRVEVGSSSTDGLASGSSALSLQNEGVFQVGWNMFPYSGVHTVGTWCPGKTRSYVSATATNGAATCAFNGWISSAPDDCRANIYYAIGGFSNDLCRWFVYEN